VTSFCDSLEASCGGTELMIDWTISVILMIDSITWMVLFEFLVLYDGLYDKLTKRNSK
jgi:hypothetical protein